MTCWKCHESTGGPVCVGCGAIQPLPADVDLFQVLGLPRRYHLPPNAVEQAVRERSRRVHPDRHVAASAVERRMALQWTARVNEARRVLREPLERAFYLVFGRLWQEEVPAPEDPAFIEQVFNWRMGAERDDTDTAAQVEAVRASLLARLDGVFQDWESGTGDLEPARDVLSRLRFVENVAAEMAL